MMLTGDVLMASEKTQLLVKLLLVSILPITTPLSTREGHNLDSGADIRRGAF